MNYPVHGRGYSREYITHPSFDILCFADIDHVGGAARTKPLEFDRGGTIEHWRNSLWPEAPRQAALMVPDLTMAGSLGLGSWVRMVSLAAFGERGG